MFPFRTSTEKGSVSPIFELAHLAGFRPQGLRAAALQLLLAQAQKSGSLRTFSVAARRLASR